jgi:uncharacterized phage infection (PIP) family protein YhgE
MKKTQFALDLREALGAESAGLWVFFMDKVRVTLPFLMDTAGRPKAEIVQASAIGQAGFSSWSEMIEESPEQGGLGWSVDSWKAWKRAYGVVQAHPYLRDLELTASEINTLSREIQPFPPTPEALEAAKVGRTKKLDAKRGNAVAALQGQLAEAKTAIESLTTQLGRVTADLEGTKNAFTTRDGEYVDLNNKHQQAIGQLKTARERVADLEKDVSQKSETIVNQTAQLARYSKMGWFERLLAVFSPRNQ